ncbi:protein of unknown function [Clostridium beijerinckii]|nr:protein of unknown function [Clostridium beijerinckii]
MNNLTASTEILFYSGKLYHWMMHKELLKAEKHIDFYC